jgi:hypothetical protein
MGDLQVGSTQTRVCVTRADEATELRYPCVVGIADPIARVDEDAVDPGERGDFLQAIAEGLADDAAGRTMNTNELKASLEGELGPIAWR